MPKTQLILHATFDKIDQYNNLVFKYFYPDPQDSKTKLNTIVANKREKLGTDNYVFTPNTSSGFKVKVPTAKQTDELKDYIGEIVEVAVEMSYYKFNKTNGEQIQGYKLALKNIVKLSNC